MYLRYVQSLAKLGRNTPGPKRKERKEHEKQLAILPSDSVHAKVA